VGEALMVAVSELVEAPLLSLSAGEVTAELREDFAVVQRLSGRILALVHHASVMGVPSAQAASSTGAWLAETLGMSIRQASGWAKLADRLPSVPAVADGLAAGTVNVEQAQVIAATVADLPAEVGPEGKTRAAAVLTGLAAEERVRPEVLARHKTTILEMVAPEIAEERLRKQLERADRSAYQRRGLTLSPDGDGGWRLRALLDTEAAAYVRAALDPISAPGALLDEPSLDSTGDRDSDDRDRGDGGSGAVQRDRRSAAARRADALTYLCKRALDDGDALPVSGGERPHLVVTMPWERLRDQVGAGLLDTGDLLTPATVRRLACDAKIIPAVLGGAGQVLDVGRARRLIDGPLRRALVARDRGCAWPGCDRPPRWADGHHIRHWSDGGPTSLDNAVLLCGMHHREIHKGQWAVRIAVDGLPEFIPPQHLDALQRPRRNIIHRRT
jgi:Domain of unknown function (DUF222)/HNH endonuclease